MYPMNLPSFQIAIWNKPHRAYGWLIEIDSDEVMEGLPGGIVQSFSDLPSIQRWPEIQYEFPHTKFKVSPQTIEAKAFSVSIVPYDGPIEGVELGDPPRYFFYISSFGCQLVDIHIERSNQDICIKQNLDVTLNSGDIVQIGGLAC